MIAKQVNVAEDEDVEAEVEVEEEEEADKVKLPTMKRKVDPFEVMVEEIFRDKNSSAIMVTSLDIMLEIVGVRLKMVKKKLIMSRMKKSMPLY